MSSSLIIGLFFWKNLPLQVPLSAITVVWEEMGAFGTSSPIIGFFIFKIRILSKRLDLRSRLRVRNRQVHLSTHFLPLNPVKPAYRVFFASFPTVMGKRTGIVIV